jgi:hypothetical protein
MSIISPYNIAVYEDTGWYRYPLYTTNKYFSMINPSIPIEKYASIPIIIDNKDYYLHIHDYKAYYADFSIHDKIAIVTNYGTHWVVKSRNFRKLEFWVTITTTSSKKMSYTIKFSDEYRNLNFFLDYSISVLSIVSSGSGGIKVSDTNRDIGLTYSSSIYSMAGVFYKYMSTSATFTFKMKSVFDGTEETVKTITLNGDNLSVNGGSTTIFFSFDI